MYLRVNDRAREKHASKFLQPSRPHRYRTPSLLIQQTRRQVLQTRGYCRHCRHADKKLLTQTRSRQEAFLESLYGQASCFEELLASCSCFQEQHLRKCSPAGSVSARPVLARCRLPDPLNTGAMIAPRSVPAVWKGSFRAEHQGCSCGPCIVGAACLSLAWPLPCSCGPVAYAAQLLLVRPDYCFYLSLLQPVRRCGPLLQPGRCSRGPPDRCFCGPPDRCFVARPIAAFVARPIVALRPARSRFCESQSLL